MLKRGERPHKEFRRFDFLIPLTAQCTLIEPGDRLYGELGKLETQARGAFLSFAPGFPAADVPDCGPTAFGMGFDKAQLESAIEAFRRRVADEEENFEAEFMNADAGVRKAIQIARNATRPVLLADTQDNPGAGGNGDTTGLLGALLTFRAPRSLLGLLYDPEAAVRAHQAGEGKELEFSLGARSGLPGVLPITGRFTVERLSNGEFDCTGPYYRGMRMKLGPTAALRRDDISVVVTSKKVQAADMAMFTHLGLYPAFFKIVGLKSSVHFRAHFQKIAEKVLVVAAPGPNPADPSTLPWTKLRKGIRLKPRGPAFGSAEVA
jgi:microcystin degradation protein MlrC